MKWFVDMTDEAKAQLELDIRRRLITSESAAVLKEWITEVETAGLEYAQANPTWRDHALTGKWRGYRSVTFSYRGRVIYKVEDGKLIVMVVRVTTTHNYK